MWSAWTDGHSSSNQSSIRMRACQSAHLLHTSCLARDVCELTPTTPQKSMWSYRAPNKEQNWRSSPLRATGWSKNSKKRSSSKPVSTCSGFEKNGDCRVNPWAKEIAVQCKKRFSLQRKVKEFLLQKNWVKFHFCALCRIVRESSQTSLLSTTLVRWALVSLMSFCLTILGHINDLYTFVPLSPRAPNCKKN